jgi:hypothetical protein
MRRRLFNIVTVTSLLLCIASGALWVRGLDHAECVYWRYCHWPQLKEVHSYYFGIAWYRNTLRFEGSSRSLTPEYFRAYPAEAFQRARSEYKSGLSCDFARNGVMHLSPYSPGVGAKFSKDKLGGRQWHVAVRPWLTTLLTGVLPAIWLYRWQRAKPHRWQFGIRNLFVVTTVLALVLCVIIWLKN